MVADRCNNHRNRHHIADGQSTDVNDSYGAIRSKIRTSAMGTDLSYDFALDNAHF